MPLPTTPRDSLSRSFDFPRVFGRTRNRDYELYEEDGAFVLSVEMPGFERDEISVRWHEGRLNIAAEHEDDRRGTTRTYHRAFRVPKAVVPEDITAEYDNGILEVRLPIRGATERGTPIEVE